MLIVFVVSADEVNGCYVHVHQLILNPHNQPSQQISTGHSELKLRTTTHIHSHTHTHTHSHNHTYIHTAHLACLDIADIDSFILIQWNGFPKVYRREKKEHQMTTAHSPSPLSPPPSSSLTLSGQLQSEWEGCTPLGHSASTCRQGYDEPSCL